MFNYRMFMLTGDAEYADWAERMMYNTLNSGIDLQGEHWFYNLSDDGALWVDFYGGNQLSTTLADGSEIVLPQISDYPWDGKVTVTIEKIKNKLVN